MTTKEFQQKSSLQIFLSYFRPHKRLFIAALCCALLISVIDLTFPYVSRWCMYELLPKSAYRTFFTVMAVVCVAFMLRALLTYVICYWGHTFGILVEADIREDLFRHMQELSFGYYDRNRTGQLMSRLTGDLFEITELAHHGPEDVFFSGVTIVGALAVMFTIQWRLALVIALILPVFFTVVWRCRRSMREASAKVKRTTAVINAAIKGGNIPRNWLYCFNSDCQHQEECIRFRSTVALSGSRTWGNAVYPAALHADGSCEHFKQLRIVRQAWGFNLLFKDVKLHDAPTLRSLMKEYLGGNTMYYRYHHGERLLSPEQQAWIKRLFARYCYSDVDFDNSCEELDFL